MKYVIRIALLLLIVGLAVYTYKSVMDPIRKKALIEEKEAEVIAKLKVLRDGELAYKDVHGKFAGTFDELLGFMENGQMTTLIQDGNKDDSTTIFTSRAISYSVKDSLFKNVDIANLKFVPGTTTEFLIGAGEVKKNNVTVPVFEIKDPKPFNEERREKNKPLKVGSLFDVNYNGNWK
jgi:hypothetical protein